MWAVIEMLNPLSLKDVVDRALPGDGYHPVVIIDTENGDVFFDCTPSVSLTNGETVVYTECDEYWESDYGKRWFAYDDRDFYMFDIPSWDIKKGKRSNYKLDNL